MRGNGRKELTDENTDAREDKRAGEGEPVHVPRLAGVPVPLLWRVLFDPEEEDEVHDGEDEKGGQLEGKTSKEDLGVFVSPNP
jgi:hypothetical protein